jgi:hypothetical protein
LRVPRGSPATGIRGVCGSPITCSTFYFLSSACSSSFARTREKWREDFARKSTQCGKRLNAIKEKVGHGNWKTWREGNWPQLKEQTTQVYILIDAQNLNTQRLAHLKFDPIRKYTIGFVPEKERPALQGDKKFSRPTHYSSALGECTSFSNELNRDNRPTREAK